jgi:hypothetical protein
MSESPIFNTAEASSTVGIQASVVHDSNVYISSPEAPPKERFQKAVRFLESGVAYRARELLDELLAEKYAPIEVRFYWLLAVLKRKSYREIGASDHDQIRGMREITEAYPDSEWKAGIRAIYGILDSLQEDRQVDPNVELKRLRDLPSRQYGAIAKHLEYLLPGPVKEAGWSDMIEAAHAARYARGRMERMWAYFAPKPIDPRAPVLHLPYHPTGRIVFGFVGLFASLAGIGWMAIVQGFWSDVAALGFMLVGGFVGFREALEWRFRSGLIRQKDLEMSNVGGGVDRDNSNGFAGSVSRRFEYYFRKYAPMDPDVWLQETSGIRKKLRDELVEIYREARVGEARIRWLIKFLAIDVRDCWRDGILWDYRERYRAPLSVKLSCSVGLLVAFGGAVLVADEIPSYESSLASVFLVASVISGYLAVRAWFEKALAERRFAEAEKENGRELEKRKREFYRWKQKLESLRPTEEEMESWFTSDKTLLLDEALRAHRVSWHDVTVYAFLQAPAKNCQRAKVKGGPWRYSRYEVRIFLLTTDGVREIATTLDFRRSEFGEQVRSNYRFDAVSSVLVSTRNGNADTIDLTLVDGSTKKIAVGDSADEVFDISEGEETSTRMTLETSGFAHVVRVLEGIAAEGKKWMQRSTSPV